jgi:hypothetical protein
MANHPPEQHPKHPFAGPCLLFLLSLAITFSACSPGGSTPAPSNRGTTTPTGSNSPTTTQTPQVLLGVQPCPDAVKAPSHWDTIVGADDLHKGTEQVSCANLVGNPTLQALVTVRTGASTGLNVYIYDNITGNTPTQIFKLAGLIDGEAKISGYNTVLTGEVDPHSSVNKGKSAAVFTVDLFREFKWSDAAGALVQTTFPGIYPDLTRYQAETDQAMVNQGQDFWKTTATQVATHLAVDLLKWPSANASAESGGGASDTDAIVLVTTSGPNKQVRISLSRLEGNTNGGIWEAILVAIGTTPLITAPQSRASVTSPVTVKGRSRNGGFEGVIGKVSILDHLYTDIGHTTVHGSPSFSISVTYASSLNPGGAEEGVAVFFPDNPSGGAQPAEMVKVLISA